MSEFRLATPEDDALLRRLLRDNSMPSWVEMRLEREPSFFAAHGFYGQDWAVIAQERGQAFGMYAAATVPIYVNGKAVCGGYLGGLRVQASERQRIRHLREGYASIRALAPVLPDFSWWFTVIAAENTPARRVLEAGLRGLPHYRPLGAMTTYAMASARGSRQGLWRRATAQDLPALLEFHAAQAGAYQLAPVLTKDGVARIGLDCFYIHEDQGRILALAAWWDQRAFKQVVAHRYHRALQWALPLYNGLARLSRRVPLPPPGQALPQSFIAFSVFHPSLLAHRETACSLMRDLLSHCPTPVAAIGLGAGHPLTPVIAAFKPLTYRTLVYAVEFEESADLDGRPVQPEVALL